MSSKWFEYAQKNISPDERIVKNYPGKLKGDYGYLMISNKKLFFVKEEGFLRKKYSTPFILSYDKIKDATPIDDYRLRVSEKTGETHEFSCDATLVNKAIQEEMN